MLVKTNGIGQLMVIVSAAAKVLLLSACGNSAPDSIDSARAGPVEPNPNSSLPSVKSGHRPGPDILYADSPSAPQLENLPPWAAEPILISGAAAYRNGEFLYQDYLYDDHGAFGTEANNEPMDETLRFNSSSKRGTLIYPTAADTFFNNGADLVELRVKPLADATAIRVTLNSLAKPELTAFTIAIGDSAAAVAWPHEAKVKSPARFFLTVHGAAAELLDAASGGAIAPAPTVNVDLERRQFDVRIPHVAWNPGRDVVRMAAGIGIWDPVAGRYPAPAGGATDTVPGGASASGATLFNMAFRYDEPVPVRKSWPVEFLTNDAGNDSYWRERAQADVLATGDVSPFFDSIDFGKLADGVSDDSRVPTTGSLNRIFVSRSSFGQGVDFTQLCGGGIDPVVIHPCEGAFRGQLQPYHLYIPSKPQPAAGYGFTLQLHGQSGNHNNWLGTHYMAQMGERGAGSLVATPLSRGPDGYYGDYAGADVFEVWADVAQHYVLDPDWTAITGYSMGCYGTTLFLSRWPDLFARAVGGGCVPSTTGLPSYRNTLLSIWIGTGDANNPVLQETTFQEMMAAGLRFFWRSFPNFEHASAGNQDEWTDAANYLGEHRVDRNPPHVSYFIDPSFDYAPALLTSDHAYWISGLRLRDTATGKTGLIDARSEGFGVGDAPVLPLTVNAGNMQGTIYPAATFVDRIQDWGRAPQTPVADRLVISATNLASFTIDPVRARVSCAAELQVTTDGPLTVTLDGCGRTENFP